VELFLSSPLEEIIHVYGLLSFHLLLLPRIPSTSAPDPFLTLNFPVPLHSRFPLAPFPKAGLKNYKRPSFKGPLRILGPPPATLTSRLPSRAAPRLLPNKQVPSPSAGTCSSLSLHAKPSGVPHSPNPLHISIHKYVSFFADFPRDVPTLPPQV